MAIEIVTHCWAREVPIYATLLRVQLTSLVKFQHKTPFQITICCDYHDKLVWKVLDHFKHKLPLKIIPMSDRHIWRRSIGRNQAAMESKADIVWFTDCDYWFGNGCFDSVRDQWSKLDRPDLIWPFAYLANENKDEIDAFIRHNFETDGEVVPIFEHWTLKSNPRAIGGVQIASGKFVRQHGYLNNHAKWQRPADRPFPDFRDDIVFREMVLKLGVGSSAKIEGLYRMRHTEVGYGVK